MFESLINKFQLRLKDRTSAGNLLAGSLKDFMKKERLTDDDDILILGIPRACVITADVIV